MRTQKKQQIPKSVMTAQEFINIRDIQGKVLYTKDNLAFCFIRIHPVGIELLSDREKQFLISSLTAELSSEQKPFKFFAISRPVDISNLTDELLELYRSTKDPVQKEILRQEISEYNNYAMSGDVVERQFFLIIWEQVNEDIAFTLEKRARDLGSRLAVCNISASISEQNQIVQLCNLFANPAYAHLEDSNITPLIPLLKEGSL